MCIRDRGSGPIGSELSPSTPVRLSPQNVRDIIGAMFTGNTEDGAISSYDEDRGKINFDVEASVSRTPISFTDINGAILRHLQGRDPGEYWIVINKDTNT